MGRKPRDWLLWSAIIIFFSMVSLPYLYAHIGAGTDYIFGGFLLNPIDGNSYLAKMRQGFGGSWQFMLPYTAQPENGSYLFLFYLFLGNLARTFNWSLLFTFHFARLLGTATLVLSLYRFCSAIIPSPKTRILAFSLAGIGSGLGWLAFSLATYGSAVGWLPSGVEVVTSDFWVAEAFPFLSAYANPHFAIGLAIQLWLLMPIRTKQLDWQYGLRYLFAAILLAEISPFAIPVVIVVYIGLLLWKFLDKENAKPEFLRLIWVGLGSAPILIYDLWVINAHPVLSRWNAQNLTLSPPVWDLFISIAPAIFLVVLAARHFFRSKETVPRTLLVWLIGCLVLLYFPFNLQRRFLNGFFVPVALLAALGVQYLAADSAIRFRRYVSVLIALSLPTNLIILATAVFGVQTHDAQFYVTKGEILAYSWINTSLPENSLVLASPETGLYLPAYSHASVVYGHPFETLDADYLESEVTSFFSGWNEQQVISFIDDFQVQYLFLGPRERLLGNLIIQENWQLVYESMQVTIYAVDQ